MNRPRLHIEGRPEDIGRRADLAAVTLGVPLRIPVEDRAQMRAAQLRGTATRMRKGIKHNALTAEQLDDVAAILDELATRGARP